MTQSVESFDHQRCHHQGCHVGFYRSRGDEGVVFECSQRLDIENSLLAYMSRLPRNKDSGSQEDVFSLEKQANSGYRNIRGIMASTGTGSHQGATAQLWRGC